MRAAWAAKLTRDRIRSNTILLDNVRLMQHMLPVVDGPTFAAGQGAAVPSGSEPSRTRPVAEGAGAAPRVGQLQRGMISIDDVVQSMTTTARRTRMKAGAVSQEGSMRGLATGPSAGTGVGGWDADAVMRAVDRFSYLPQ